MFGINKQLEKDESSSSEDDEKLKVAPTNHSAHDDDDEPYVPNPAKYMPKTNEDILLIKQYFMDTFPMLASIIGTYDYKMAKQIMRMEDIDDDLMFLHELTGLLAYEEFGKLLNIEKSKLDAVFVACTRAYNGDLAWEESYLSEIYFKNESQ